MLSVVQLSDLPKDALGDRRSADHLGQGENLFLDLRCQTQEPHDLGHPGAGDALPAGDGSLVGDLAGLKEGLPLKGLAEEFHHPVINVN